MHPFQKRINYRGDLKLLLKKVIEDYGFSKYQSHEVVIVGFEDFNIILKTVNGKYFVKFLAHYRNEKECKRYSEIVIEAIKNGINHPKLYQSKNGYLDTINIDGNKIYILVEEFIDGKTFFDLKQTPNSKERDILINQTAKINSLNLNLFRTYDRWAIINIIQEYEKSEEKLIKQDIDLIKPLIEELKKIDIAKLPQCVTHADLNDSNVMKDINGNIYILDFSVANIYPRINDLAILLSSLIFSYDKNVYANIYSRALEIYQQTIILTDIEISLLPLFIKLAHAANIIGVMNNNDDLVDPEENEFWISKGRKGLEFSLNFWN